ncbi:MAG: PepSY-like domain-containing protein [Alistipes sp.]|nr:PepSY-like domain-containing protein [Alistipes sp.]
MKQLLWIAAVVLYVLPTYADNYRMMTVEQLPRNAQELLTAHFPDDRISYAASDRNFLNRDYKVFFSDGGTIEFDRYGKWTEIDGSRRSVPDALIPDGILRVLRKRFSGDPIVKIERSRKGYDVELRSGMEMKFNSHAELIEVDD